MRVAGAAVRKKRDAPSGVDAPDPLALLQWYDRHRRHLPWRSAPGERADPYHVWLSEIMLQQTTVKAVGPYYAKFLTRWPDVTALAAAPLDEVLKAWAGLGYYARARNLHACAMAVAEQHRGWFPDTEDALRTLPGIGGYTAAAIAAIAFDRHAVAIDGNIERVIARLFAIEAELPAAKAEIRAHAERLVPQRRPGDFTQAMMDLGATICLPRKPKCMLCPLCEDCAARRHGNPEALPARAPKAVRPKRHGVVFWTQRPDGAVLLRRRPENGLLGGLFEVPSTDWRAAPWDIGEAEGEAPLPAAWRPLDGIVRHGFTHFELELSLLAGTVGAAGAWQGTWCPVEHLSDYALPTLMKKVVRHALAKL